MKTLLNEQGKELVLVKERISNKEIPNDIVSIILSKYPKEIQTILEANISTDCFTQELTKYPEYMLTKSEILNIKNEDMCSMYDKELSLTNSKYTVEVDNNILRVDKYFRIGKEYYKNFLGIDLGELLNEYMKDKSKNKNSCMYLGDKPKSNAELRYEAELENYNWFVKNRLYIVLGLLEKSIYKNKVMPEYKNIKKNDLKPIRVSWKIEDNVGTISLSINLDKKDNFKENIKTIKNFLNIVEDNIERHMGYSLYK